MPQHWLLTESIVNMLFTLADGFGLHRFYDLCFLSWMFLFRVVSEAIDLQAGYAAISPITRLLAIVMFVSMAMGQSWFAWYAE